MNRYFLVWYSTNINQNNRATVTNDEYFINEHDFEEHIKATNVGVTSMLITNIFEFKSVHDFDEFNRK